jgi:hypothetical protein
MPQARPPRGGSPDDDRSPGALQRLLGGDLGPITQVVRLIPDIAAYLAEIRDLTRHMDREVTDMHAAVEKLEVGLSDLEAQVAELSRVLRPFRRARARLPGRAA